MTSSPAHRPSEITVDPKAIRPIPAERVVYANLEQLMAASPDIVVGTVKRLGPDTKVDADPNDPSVPDLQAPTAEIAVERNLAGSAPTVNVLDVDFDGRAPLRSGERILAFLVPNPDKGATWTHGMIDYLAVDEAGVLHTLLDSSDGAAPMSIDELRGSGGAAFLSGLTLDEVIASITSKG